MTLRAVCGVFVAGITGFILRCHQATPETLNFRFCCCIASSRYSIRNSQESVATLLREVAHNSPVTVAIRHPLKLSSQRSFPQCRRERVRLG